MSGHEPAFGVQPQVATRRTFWPLFFSPKGFRMVNNLIFWVKIKFLFVNTTLRLALLMVDLWWSSELESQGKTRALMRTKV